MEGFEEYDYSEEMAKEAWLEGQNIKDRYEAMQDANARAEAEAQIETEKEYNELHKDCISKQKVIDAIDKICCYPFWSKLKDTPTRINQELKKELRL